MEILNVDNIRSSIYRRFSEEAHAQAMCEGRIWLSTLERCRRYEDAEQGDPDEARHRQHIGVVKYGDSDYVRTAARLGFPASEGGVFSDIVVIRQVLQAWVLCLSSEPMDHMADKFGKHLVRIDKPHRFFDRLTLVVRRNVPAVQSAGFGAIRYKSRDAALFDPEPGPIGFVKPAHPYGNQREVRMLWVPYDHREIAPMDIKCPSVAHLCKLVA